MSECQCPGPGYCDRHGFIKTPHTYNLCRNREDYRAQWDRGAVKRKAAKPVTPDLGLLVRAGKFARSFLEWVSGGAPKRTAQRQLELLQICQACDWYLDGECRKCGCSLAKKISWATTACPEGKWGPE